MLIVDQWLLHQLLFQEATHSSFTIIVQVRPGTSGGRPCFLHELELSGGTDDKFYLSWLPFYWECTMGDGCHILVTDQQPSLESMRTCLRWRNSTRSLWPDERYSSLLHGKQQTRPIQCRAVGIARDQVSPEPQWEGSSQCHFWVQLLRVMCTWAVPLP